LRELGKGPEKTGIPQLMKRVTGKIHKWESLVETMS